MQTEKNETVNIRLEPEKSTPDFAEGYIEGYKRGVENTRLYFWYFLCGAFVVLTIMMISEYK